MQGPCAGLNADAGSGIEVGTSARLRGAQSPRLSTGCQPAVNASVNALAMRWVFLAVGPSRAELLLLLLLLLLPGLRLETAPCEPTE